MNPNAKPEQAGEWRVIGEICNRGGNKIWAPDCYVAIIETETRVKIEVLGPSHTATEATAKRIVEDHNFMIGLGRDEQFEAMSKENERMYKHIVDLRAKLQEAEATASNLRSELQKAENRNRIKNEDLLP